MKGRLICSAVFLFLSTFNIQAATAKEYKNLTISSDSLTARLSRYMGFGDWKVEIKNLKRKGNCIDVVFSQEIMSWPWHESSLNWFREEVSKELELQTGGMALGKLSCKNIDMEELVTPVLNNQGLPSDEYRFRMKDPRTRKSWPFIRRDGARRYSKGLSDRYIALWQSHGMVYSPTDSAWTWQRARLHRTVEDMYTQSYVLPFLIPMLENAGAYVITPRERDTQRLEVVCDNDSSFEGERDSLTRRCGFYEEKGHWQDGGQGFADTLRWYNSTSNPFSMGTARKCATSRHAGAYARWTPNVARRGQYAVYISYRSYPNSATDAHYTVKHLGGETSFRVNQRRGGGTWIYLGTFEFAPGKEHCVELDNSSGKSSQIVSADAVRFGGGMGKVMREGTVSGMPAYCEGALYSMIWAGIDSTLYCEWERDYTRDYASRGRWCKTMRDERDIPLDLSLAFHTDAGTTPNDSIVGTLAIYTLKEEGKRNLPSGGDRMCSRTFADMVQTQLVNDLREDYDPLWSRRRLWDKSYSECRTSDMPAMLLELLSHQNFTDMKYGLDPAFRFSVCRSVYKGILKFLSELYGCGYRVQPLPVHSFAARLDGKKACLSWESTPDIKEPSAISEGYILYSRKDDGAWDQGIEIKENHAEVELETGHIYSFKVEAWNSGGKSFPSEILSVGLAPQGKGRVLIVNNFDRVSAPAVVESPGYAGFDARLDGGVPYINDISYIGENYEYRRALRWESDGNPGFGASWDDRAGGIIAGNSFDYPAVHGRSLMLLGYSFESISRQAFERMSARMAADSTAAPDSTLSAIDLICGKQARSVIGNGRVPARYEVFPDSLRSALSYWLSGKCKLIITGANISTDPYLNAENKETGEWVSTALGYKHGNSFGTYTNSIEWKKGRKRPAMSFYKKPNAQSYCVECPDALIPTDKNAKILLKYSGTGAIAALCYEKDGNKVISMGVPLECLCREEDRISILSAMMETLK